MGGFRRGCANLATWREEISSSSGGLPRLEPALRAIADELARAQSDIFVVGAPQAVGPLRRASPETPIVLGISTDPVGRGFAQSLSHPGGMITGVPANSVDDTAPKQIELLVSTVPNLTRLGVLGNSSGPNVTSVMKNVHAAATASNITIVTADARTPEDFNGAFEHFTASACRRSWSFPIFCSTFIGNALSISRREPSAVDV